MSLPVQIAAYTDCYEIWSTAAQLRVGCRTFVGPDYAKAEYLRMRMHQARSLLRDQSKRAYPREHPLWGQSDYDAYKITLKPDEDTNYWLYVELHGNWAAAANIEPIPPDELGVLPPAMSPEILPHRQLEAPNGQQDDLE